MDSPAGVDARAGGGESGVTGEPAGVAFEGNAVSGACGGAMAQPASKPRMAAGPSRMRRRDNEPGDHGMLMIVLEALAALMLLLFIVWWTMFSGRRRGEPDHDDDDGPQPP
jgi:hypothetical protein